MALTPIDYTVNEEEVQTVSTIQTVQPSRTWQIDLDSGRIRSIIDGEDAIRQYIHKALMTARNRYLIYDDTYGEEIRDLIGHNLTPALRDVEIPRLVREAIVYDERISEVSDVVITQYTTDSILIEVTVVLADGEILTEGVAI